MNETLDTKKLLDYLHQLADGFSKCGQDRLSNEILNLIDEIERGNFNSK